MIPEVEAFQNALFKTSTELWGLCRASVVAIDRRVEAIQQLMHIVDLPSPELPQDGDAVPCNEKDISALGAAYRRIAELERRNAALEAYVRECAECFGIDKHALLPGFGALHAILDRAAALLGDGDSKPPQCNSECLGVRCERQTGHGGLHHSRRDDSFHSWSDGAADKETP